MAKSPSSRPRLDRPKAIELMRRLSQDSGVSPETKGRLRRSMKVLQKIEARRQAKK